MDVKHLGETLEPKDLSAEGGYQIAKHVRSSWKRENIQFREFSGGTNHLVGVYDKNDPDDIILVRVHGSSSEKFVNRKKELEIFKLLHDRGYAPKLYLTFENGMAFEYLPGIQLNSELVLNPGVAKLVAQMMAKIHKINLNTNDSSFKEPILWDLLGRFLDLIPEKFSNSENESRFRRCCPEGKHNLTMELEHLRKVLHSLGNSVVLCHNDLILPNVLYIEKKNSITFIDYEFADYNYQAFDIAMHFTSFADEGGFENAQYPNEAYQLQWIREYLKEFKNLQSVNEDCVRQLYEHTCQFTTAANFFGVVGNFMQAEFSVIDFDYMKMATDKYREYKKSLRYIQA